MANVKGIGGVFIHADDPTALAAWYQRYLGIEFRYESSAAVYYTVFVHWDADKPDLRRDTTFAIFPARGAGRTGRGDYTINYRVDDLAAMVADLHQAGIATEEIRVEQDEEGYGKFTRLYDPEGNRLELYEPIR